MSEGPKTLRRWYQVKLRDIFVATFWVGIACGAATMTQFATHDQARAPIWTFVAAFSSLAAFWSLQGRYWFVVGTVAYAALFFLLMLWLHKEAILG